MNFLHKPSASLLLALLTAACASVPPATHPEAIGHNKSASNERSTLKKPAASGPAVPVAKTNEARPTALDFEHNVYFNTGSIRLDARGRSTLQAIAAKLKADRELRVALSGHTDHLGSSEYNLALGQKRIDVVVRELITFGAWNRQVVQRTSYGNELGGDDGCSSEECRQSERRVELQLSGGNEKTEPRSSAD